MVIIEGPDGSGKTTLANKIVKETGMQYRRYEGLSSELGPTDAGIVYWWQEQMKKQRNSGVYDRCFFISEVVYQLVMNGRPLITTGQEMLEGIYDLWALGPMIIFCLPPWETQWANIAAQPAKLLGVEEDDLEKVSWAYHSLFAMWSNSMLDNVISYDYTEEDLDFVFVEIEKHKERHGSAHSAS